MKFSYISLACLLAAACVPADSASTGDQESEVAAAPAAPAAQGVQLDMSTVSAGALALPEAMGFDGAVVGGELLLGPFVTVYSTETVPVQPGDVVEWAYSARSVSDPTNGLANNFFAGPVGMDASGQIVQWWEEQAPITVAEGVRTGGGRWMVGEGVVAVKVGLNGNWSETQPSADGVIGIQSIQIRRAAPTP